jgi:hypothetical protein
MLRSLTMSAGRLPALARVARTSYMRLSTSPATDKAAEPAKKGWLHSAEFWGFGGALAGWGLMASAIYDALYKGPEIISLNMTPVQIVYSGLFARWAWVVKPQNLLLCACHVSNVIAQLNQLRRAVEYQIAQGREEEVKAAGMQAALGGAGLLGLLVAGPALRAMVVGMSLPGLSAWAESAAGPFTVSTSGPHCVLQSVARDAQCSNLRTRNDQRCVRNTQPFNWVFSRPQISIHRQLSRAWKTT